MYYTEYEGIKVYGLFYHSGEHEGIPDVAGIMREAINLSMEVFDPHYYDATDIDGISIFLLITDKKLPTGTILEKVVHQLEDLEDPEASYTNWNDEWLKGQRYHIVQEDGTVKEDW
jgi:hypothetical protein